MTLGENKAIARLLSSESSKPPLGADSLLAQQVLSLALLQLHKEAIMELRLGAPLLWEPGLI